jgi:hypothetical protein
MMARMGQGVSRLEQSGEQVRTGFDVDWFVIDVDSDRRHQ